jgi:hypothetical protein
MGPIRSASRAETLPPAFRPVCSVLVIWQAGSGPPLLELEIAYLAAPRLRMFLLKTCRNRNNNRRDSVAGGFITQRKRAV